jgi:hypothetical protein
MAGAVNTIGQSKRGGGDRSSRPAQLQARENEQKALSLWIKGATYQQIAAAAFGIATASGAWRAVHRALDNRKAKGRALDGTGLPESLVGRQDNGLMPMRDQSL